MHVWQYHFKLLKSKAKLRYTGNIPYLRNQNLQKWGNVSVLKKIITTITHSGAHTRCTNNMHRLLICSQCLDSFLKICATVLLLLQENVHFSLISIIFYLLSFLCFSQETKKKTIAILKALDQCRNLSRYNTLFLPVLTCYV